MLSHAIACHRMSLQFGACRRVLLHVAACRCMPLQAVACCRTPLRVVVVTGAAQIPSRADLLATGKRADCLASGGRADLLATGDSAAGGLPRGLDCESGPPAHQLGSVSLRREDASDPLRLSSRDGDTLAEPTVGSCCAPGEDSNSSLVHARILRACHACVPCMRIMLARIMR